MRTTTSLCTLAVGLLFCSCNPKISTQLIKLGTPLDNNMEVAVIGLDDTLPSNAEVIGELSIDDTGFTTSCSYDYVLELAKEEVRKAGGNALKITKHKTPDMLSSCHRISAEILLVGAAVFGQKEQDVPDTSDSHLVEANGSVTNGSILNMTDPRIRFSVYGGLSQLLGKNPDVDDPLLDQYNKNLNSGYNVGADFTYFISDVTGFGIKCNMLRTSNSLNNVNVYDDYGNHRYGDISDDITLFFVGPALSYRKIAFDKKSTLYFSAAAGYDGYYNRACVINPLIASGSTLGTSMDLGYDIFLSKKVALAIKLSMTSGVLKKLTVNNGYTKEQYSLESGSYISLNHIDLSLGFCFVR